LYNALDNLIPPKAQYPLSSSELDNHRKARELVAVLANREKELHLLIKVSKQVDSSIAVLEGNYCDWNDFVCKPALAQEAAYDKIFSVNHTVVSNELVLSGTEIKSIRNGKANLKDSYAAIKNGELYIYNLHISPYEFGNIYNKDPLRDRKLLVNKREINKLVGLIKQKGYSLIPLSMYFKGNLVKIELGIGKGKKLYDKRRDIAKKEAEMRMRRVKN
jgi:SsrA-binding protein